LAYESLAVISNALMKLEVGDLSVCRWVYHRKCHQQHLSGLKSGVVDPGGKNSIYPVKYPNDFL